MMSQKRITNVKIAERGAIEADIEKAARMYARQMNRRTHGCDAAEGWENWVSYAREMVAELRGHTLRDYLDAGLGMDLDQRQHHQ